MKRGLLELGKSLLIVILILSLLFLTAAAMPMDMIRNTPWLSGLLQPFAPLLGLPEAELAYVADAQTVQSAAQPLSISIQTPAGRHTAQWSFSELDSVYDTLGGLLGQALDTAGAFAPDTEERLQEALSLPSVCFDYGNPLPPSLIASWLDAASDDSLPVSSRFVLALEGDQVAIWLCGARYSRAVTQINPREFSALLEQFQPDGSQFGFEANSRLAALTLLPAATPVMAAAEAASPCDNRYIESLATALGFNPYDDSRYTDSGGTTHFSENSCSLQISASGEILLLSSSEERFHAASAATEALVEEARALAELAAGGLSADGRLYLSSVSGTDGETVCAFEYVLNGIPVTCGDRPAVTVAFSGRAMTRLEVRAIRFTLSGETVQLLPPAQAAAILPEGGALALRYHYSGSGALGAGWSK